MAVKQSTIEWKGMGGRTTIYIPDRLNIICPRCSQEIGAKANLAFVSQGGELAIGIECECSPGVVLVPKVAMK